MNIRSIVTSLLVMVSLAMTVMAPALTYADDTGTTTDPATQSVCDAINCDTSQGPSVGKIVKLVVNVLSFLIGFVAVLMIIINGFRFVISNGDSSKIATARMAILYAIIGLVVAAVAQILVHFVLNQVNNADNITTVPPAATCTAHPQTAGCPKAKK